MKPKTVHIDGGAEPELFLVHHTCGDIRGLAHLPNSRSYGATRISETKGER